MFINNDIFSFEIFLKNQNKLAKPVVAESVKYKLVDKTLWENILIISMDILLKYIFYDYEMAKYTTQINFILNVTNFAPDIVYLL